MPCRAEHPPPRYDTVSVTMYLARVPSTPNPRYLRAGLIGALLLSGLPPANAQLVITRAEAERAALASGTRIALARADSAAALARLLSARALPNPTLAASYSKSAPQKHLSLEIPVFDALFTRGARVGQATAAARASRLAYASERIAALVEIDTTYTRALAANAKLRLSQLTARDADSLRKMAASRRDAGDASDLDVDLATVVAGQQQNVAADDSLSYMGVLLALQTLMGIPADSATIVLSDTLGIAGRDTVLERALATGSSTLATTPGIAAAEGALRAAELGVTLQQRSVFQMPSLSVGVEFGDPSGGEPGLLPTIGVAIPLPLFNRNEGPIAEARAERDKARAQLTVARLEARRRLVEGTRERDALIAKLARDANLVTVAQRVADKSLTAYREGASGLPAVLEARRSAREALNQYIDDLAALLTVNAELRGLTQSVTVP